MYSPHQEIESVQKKLEDYLDRHKQSEKRLIKICQCFISLGVSPALNIDKLTALCGEILDATCAMYNRLENGKIKMWGSWNIPEGFIEIDDPESHICNEVINRGDKEIFYLDNLLNRPYVSLNPNLGKYRLQTYMGQATRLEGQAVGTLCVLFNRYYSPSEEDKNLLQMVGSAIEVEERRLLAERLNQQPHQRLLTTFNSIDAVISVTDMASYEILSMNQYAEKHFGKGIGRKCWQVFQKNKTGPCDFCPAELLLSFSADPKQETCKWEHHNEITDKVYELSERVIEWIDGRYVRLQVGTDITERKEAEEKLIQAKREWEVTFDSVLEPIFILDSKFNIIRLNKSMADKAGLPLQECIGKKCFTLIHGTNGPIADCPHSKLLADGMPHKAIIHDEKHDADFIVSCSPLPDRQSGQLKSIHVLYDITEQKKTEQEKEKLLAELQGAFEQIKTLNGIVPICSYCKQIRDDKGFWQQVEEYVSRHTEAKFSHSICPQCMEKHYPEYGPKK